MEERATLSDVQNLYVYSSSSQNKVPLIEVSNIDNSLQTMRIRRLEHFRTISVQTFMKPGMLASEMFKPAEAELNKLAANLPPGYQIVVSGEQAKTEQGFKNLAVVMMISVAMIFLALAFQFKHSIKPFLVLACAPYGVAGALFALWAMNTSFGFMAFLGVASLIGVIVSHVIVLFDFIEEMHEKGEPLEEALLRCGHRAAAAGNDHGGSDSAGADSAGDAWRAAVAAVVLRADRRVGRSDVHNAAARADSLSIFVLDLKIVRWGDVGEAHAAPAPLNPQPKGEVS